MKADNSFRIKDNFIYYSKEDFADHLELLGRDFLESYRGKVFKLNPSSRRYLKKLMIKIRLSVGIFSPEVKESIFIIIDTVPFHFSVPGGKIFISHGLLKKYIKYEGVLASILALEIVRSHRMVFNKMITIPTGMISFKKIKPFLKVDQEIRNEINKWISYILKKNDFHPVSLLRLLQIKNRNFLDFYDTQEETKVAANEEVFLKKFFIENKFFDNISNVSKNSSKNFYSFISEIRDYEHRR